MIYVIINKDLQMLPGKAAAQAVHASMMLNGNSKQDFMAKTRRTVIVLEGTTDQIRNLYNYLDCASDDLYIDADYYIDEGANGVPPYSITALAAYVNEDDTKQREVFEGFYLYHGYGNVHGQDEDKKEAEMPPMPKRKWWESDKHYLKRMW